MIRPLAWVLLAMFALVLSWTTGASVFAWAGYTMFALLLLGYLTMRLSAGRLIAWRELTRDRIYPGESVRVRVRVENHSPFPALWLVAAESLPVGLPVTGVRGRVTPWVGPARIQFHVHPRRRSPRLPRTRTRPFSRSAIRSGCSSAD